MSPQPNVSVFLSQCSEEQSVLRNELSSVLQRAGMNVVAEEGVLKENNLSLIPGQIVASDCSVHIIFPQYLPLAESGVSLAKFQFLEAKANLYKNPNFKIFVWLPPSTDLKNVEPLQLDFVNEVKNNISKNMVFSNAVSAIQLADDIRCLMETKDKVSFDLNSTDIFLVSNQLDESEANDIIDMLSDIVPVETLNIIQDSDTDYSELCKQQISKSKLAVIYFKESADWALPFAQQLWKKIGGATSHTPILLIGDNDPNSNESKKFNAPKVISIIVDGALIPLEIKVQYDKVSIKTAS
ncbi:MAG: hypothetical protein V4608_04530 [Bacteroidota bacterium]